MRPRIHDARLAEYIDQYWRENYHAPSMREMAEHCNTSTCVIYNALSVYPQVVSCWAESEKPAPSSRTGCGMPSQKQTP